MAKKSRRARRGTQRRTYSVPRAPSVAPEQSPAPVRTSRAVASPARTSSVPLRGVDLREEYRYVYSDLKRIGFLAAGMFALLIALSFIIR
ncbi:MAG: hypothetical protein ACUVV0_06310 [Anaerolineae bacterium]